VGCGVRVFTILTYTSGGAEGLQMKRMWLEATFRWRVLAAQEVPLDLFVVPGDHDSDRRVDARRDQILERQEAHPQWGQG
jgi:hypothetical protein